MCDWQSIYRVSISQWSERWHQRPWVRVPVWTWLFTTCYTISKRNKIYLHWKSFIYWLTKKHWLSLSMISAKSTKYNNQCLCSIYILWSKIHYTIILLNLPDLEDNVVMKYKCVFSKYLYTWYFLCLRLTWNNRKLIIYMLFP